MDKFNIFKNMKISVRIGLSFLILLGIFIATSLFSLHIFSQSKNSFLNYSTVSSEAVAILNIDRQVSELQRVILLYSNTGNNALIVREKKSYRTLANNLSLFKESIDDEENIALLERMTKTLDGYGENIDALIETRSRRDFLVNMSMKSLSTDRSNLIKEALVIAENNGDTSTLKNIRLMNEQLLIAQVNAISFLSDRKYSYEKAAKNALLLAKNYASEILIASINSKQLHALMNTLIENISTYEDSFYQAILATRDFLFLVNVVMSGEASEFSTLSLKLKTSTLSTLDVLTESTKERLNVARKTTVWVTIGEIGLGFVLAFLISQSISRPIQKIAETFERLVDGQHDTTIPGLSRGDEIGQLAIAANVFKQMNEKTEKILGESQALTNRLQLRENELKDRTKLLQKSNDELDNFAYIASHDLKSPLRAIDNLCTWVVEDCEDILPDESREHLKTMKQRVTRMENLLSDLLKYSRVGHAEVEIETIDVKKLVENTVELINMPDTFCVKISDDLPKITTQVSPLQQVFLNLLTNAVKYGDKNNGLIEIASKHIDENFVEFSVADNGPGIESKFHQRIFQMFQTLHSRDVIESSGMGLAIIKKVIEGQGGEITIASTLGAGSVFTFSWPSNITGNKETA